MGNSDFSCFTDGSYLKGNNGCAITTPFDVDEAASFPLATLAQQTELYALTRAIVL